MPRNDKHVFSHTTQLCVRSAMVRTGAPSLPCVCSENVLGPAYRCFVSRQLSAVRCRGSLERKYCTRKSLELPHRHPAMLDSPSTLHEKGFSSLSPLS